MAYGFSSSVRVPSGASRSTSVAASDDWNVPSRPTPAGIGVRYEYSFFQRTKRRT